MKLVCLAQNGPASFKALSNPEVLWCVCVCVSGRLEKSDPEMIGAVMEYCLLTRCRSEPIFEAVAENFVSQGETHTTLQIAKQIVAMGRLNYLPQVRAACNTVLL